MHRLTPAELHSEMLMNVREAAEWLEANWRPLHQSIDEITSRRIEYCTRGGDGYLHNMGPNRSGVYFLFDADGSLVYIGKAVSIAHRLWQHFMRSCFQWSHISWIECPRECAEEIEHFYIRRHNPPFNVRILPRCGHAMARLVKKHERSNQPAR